jgi:hypothetical protein
MALNAVKFDTIGLPIVNNQAMLKSGSPQYLNDTHLIINILINIVVFLSVLLWFTLIFNIITRGWLDPDGRFVIFAVWFTLFTIVSVYLLIAYKNIS